MNLRQVKAKVRYLRKLYGELEMESNTQPLIEDGPRRARLLMAIKHLKASVPLMLDGLNY